MPDHLAMIREFHEAVGAPVLDKPKIPVDRISLRMKLLMEEHGELMYELALASWDTGPDLARIAKELADLLVVTYGCALEFGIDLNAVMAEVHRSNMSKQQVCPECRGEGEVEHGTRRDEFGNWDTETFQCHQCDGTGKVVFKRSDGKVLKGPDYTPPNVEGVLWPHPQKTSS